MLPLTVGMLLTGLAAAIGGLGFGIALSALSAHVVRAVPSSHTGAAAGMNTNILTIGGAIVATILGAHTGHDGLPTEHSWVMAFVALTVVAAIGAATCLLIPERRTARPVMTEPQPELEQLRTLRAPLLPLADCSRTPAEPPRRNTTPTSTCAIGSRHRYPKLER
jgi:MFS family permease